MDDNKVRVRFAPSPTGLLHIGGARTALFNWLLARHTGGDFILRLEDTDIVRSYPEAEHDLIRDLRWLGLDWNEGPDVGGRYGPYRQSERLDVYREVAESMERDGKAYRCYCTTEEVGARRTAAVKAGKPAHYDGRCRHLTNHEIAKFEAEGRTPSLRFAVEYHEVTLKDIIRGRIRFRSGMIGDFIILRSDGMPTYNFACVVDDSEMGISHVVRGEEHLSNTLRQCLIYEYLGIEMPAFAHLPLVLGPDRTKLSKRHEATSVEELRRLGHPPHAILNHLALLGWSPGDDREIMTKQELIERFSLERVSRSPSIFDEEKLAWITSHHVKMMTATELVKGIMPFLEALDYSTDDEQLIIRAVEALKDRGEGFSKLADHVAVLLRASRPIPENLRTRAASEDARKAISLFLEAISRASETDRRSVSELLASSLRSSGMKKGQFFMPIRIALTGTTSGPLLPVIVEVFGKQRTMALLKRGLERGG
jgi:nondiscriminating glutamyl-tRNA synthetase